MTRVTASCSLLLALAAGCGPSFFSRDGFGATAPQNAASASPAGPRPFATRVAVSRYTGCAVLRDGSVRCWDFEGRRMTRTPPLTNVSQVAVGPGFQCAVPLRGALTCWDLDFERENSVEGPADVTRHRMMRAHLEDVRSLALTGDNEAPSACAAFGDGTVSCWGDSPPIVRTRRGEEGAPRPITSAHDVESIAVSEGTAGNFADLCAVMRDTTLACWGSFGQHTEEARVYALRGVAQVAMGEHHTCVRLVDGTVQCRGANDHGQLGLGTDERERDDFAPVPGLRDVVDLASGRDHVCAVRSDGTLWCWGDGSYGALADAAHEERRVPTELRSVRDVASVGAGGLRTCVALRDGSVRCWGNSRPEVVPFDLSAPP